MVLITNIKLFFQLYYRPFGAMSSIIDEGNWFYAAALATFTAVVFQFAVTSPIYHHYEAVQTTVGEVIEKMKAEGKSPDAAPTPSETGSPTADDDDAPDLSRILTKRLPLPLVGNAGWWFLSFSPRSYFAIVLSLAALYVPATVLALVLFTRMGTFGVILRRDYGPLLACTLLAWAASHLPFAVVGLAMQKDELNANLALALWLGSNLYFGFLMVAALRTVCGARMENAAQAVGVSWVVMRMDSWLYSIATFSPFMTAIWVLPLVLGAFYGLSAAYRQRQSFRRNLEASTVNPRDSEAHYQLGLLYQQRRRYAEAIPRFKRAVEIDANETDAHYQLGRIAREQGRLQEAIDHFSHVVTQDARHSHSEIWREIGATYLAAGMPEEARGALERYHERRPFDPEGLFHLGDTLSKLGESERAREVFGQCIEAVRTMPYYRRGQVSQWEKLAKSKLSRV